MADFNLVCTCGNRLLTVTRCNPKQWLSNLHHFEFNCKCGLNWKLGSTSQYPVINDCTERPASWIGLTLVAK